MKNENVTIQEEYKLPSLGKIYNKPFDPIVKLRSMTVAEEMKRLQLAENPYKVMSEIIEDCLLTELPVSVYDMCLGDYQYLLHKLRVVTYGPEYNIYVQCDKCGNQYKSAINLDELKVNEFTEDIRKEMVIQLPVTKHTVKLRFQTPRDLDEIEHKAKELKKNFPDLKGDPKLLLTLESLIDTVDGEPLNYATALDFIKKLPLKDYNIISHKATELNGKVGIDTIITSHCDMCGNDVNSLFRFTSEFFGPAVD